jgi:aromatic-L-amino-acid decarboxylase
VDPIPAVADICEEFGLWLHVDGAYAGVTAMLPERGWVLDGADRADSIVVNPHKWLFTPIDLSAFYSRRLDVVREAFSLVPEYLRTGEEGVRNYMDYGPQLGRRFRALKLWFVLRAFGADGLRARLRQHLRLAEMLASWIEEAPDWQLLAPVPFSTVCFRFAPPGVPPDRLDTLNEAILEGVNDRGRVYLSHTVLRGQYAMRAAIGNLRTTESHVAEAWKELRTVAATVRHVHESGIA